MIHGIKDLYTDILYDLLSWNLVRVDVTDLAGLVEVPLETFVVSSCQCSKNTGDKVDSSPLLSLVSFWFGSPVDRINV
jgi:hypothetical protein